ncbi:MAG: LysR family transcriptional regulator [Burkholderiales bacterium]|nr:LysR family transcriptional regulator [Burkholderiales bacterium]
MATHKNLDLQLLECFEALMRENSVSRAAERMGLSQPAMSEALARLRDRFDDPLLVRGREGMQPTPRALELAPRVHDIVARLRELSTGAETFDPQTCVTRFRLATSDYSQFLLMPRLTEVLGGKAEGVSVDVLPVNIRRVEEALDLGEIDLAVAYFVEPPRALKHRPLYTEHYVGVARKGHPRITPSMDAPWFAALRHVSVAPSGLNYFSGAIDSLLAAQGLHRRVAVTSPHFLLAAYLAANSDLVLALPSRAARRLAAMLPLMLFDIPLELPEIRIAMYWHERTHTSAAHQWFREQVREALPHGGSRSGARLAVAR